MSPLPAPLRARRPRLDGHPRRPWSSLNIRFEDKVATDLVHTWAEAREGRTLRQWDVYSLILDAALRNPEFDVPAELRVRRRR